MYRVKTTKQFDRDVERLRKRRFDLGELQAVVDLLIAGEVLPARYKDYALKGSLMAFRECHIAPDWLLIYMLNKEGTDSCPFAHRHARRASEAVRSGENRAWLSIFPMCKRK